MRPAIYLGPAVFVQAVKDAERFFVSRGGDLAALHARQARAMERDKADTDDDEPPAPVTRTPHERSTGTFRRSTNAAHNVRTFIVRLSVRDVVHEYRIDGTDPADAAKNARRAHAAAGLPSSTAWRARIAKE